MSSDGRAMRFVHPSLRDDEEIIMAAFRRKPVKRCLEPSQTSQSTQSSQHSQSQKKCRGSGSKQVRLGRNSYYCTATMPDVEKAAECSRIWQVAMADDAFLQELDAEIERHVGEKPGSTTLNAKVRRLPQGSSP